MNLTPNDYDRVRERLRITWDLPDVEDIDIAAANQIFAKGIEDGRVKKPPNEADWLERLADLVALIKGRK